MNLHTYYCRTLAEALAYARRELGDDAAVLHTRWVRRGWLRARVMEVVATANPPATLLTDGLLRPSPTPSTATQPLATHPAPADAAPPELLAVRQLRDQLVAQGLDPALTETLLGEAHRETSATDLPTLHAAVRQRLARRLTPRTETPPPPSTGAAQKVMALVGPTGVGKTTTLAKLAANATLEAGLSVGMITIDTYRVAAVAQLRTFGDLLGAPVAVVHTAAEMRAALANMASADLVLIDSAGRSPTDAERIAQLAELLHAAQPNEVRLVASATTTPAGLRQAARSFAPVGLSSLVLTKLDEAPALGHLAVPLIEIRLPVTHLTDGQSVPEDLRVTTPTDLAGRLLGERVAPLAKAPTPDATPSGMSRPARLVPLAA
ncbi:flagellar biosynthesis protein FlhF [Botrimarina hoheduenensis]|uniref:Flagellar biosynthesis protein FlhF n=1 Tax=Botrimarina hoheduenensis TaxID=2528000 RepID=A0A5C5VXK1_9BACT|nr:AAA family ATPase [Botrimarina hoheduenensis]TWT43164.1 Flagellar biosynthesis protein FlhF [Botrimarina hoheduenensis]